MSKEVEKRGREGAYVRARDRWLRNGA
jgi:hypothetical protein